MSCDRQLSGARLDIQRIDRDLAGVAASIDSNEVAALIGRARAELRAADQRIRAALSVEELNRVRSTAEARSIADAADQAARARQVGDLAQQVFGS